MKLQKIKEKVLKGDFGNLLNVGSKENYIHPAELAGLISSLPLNAAIKTFNSLSENMKIEVFSYSDIELQKQIIKNIPKNEASTVLNGLESDDRFEFFSKIKGVERSLLLDYLSKENKEEIHDFIGYSKDSIARLVNTDFATIKRDMTIAEAMEHLRHFHNDTEAANVIYVVEDNGKLIDDIPVRKLVLNELSKKVEDILDHSYVSLKVTDSKQEAVDKFKKYDRTVLPVLNDENILIGVFTVDDVLDVAEQQNTEEMQKFGGLETLDYPYVHTSFFSLIKKRAGWLIILFISEMLTATAMGYFDAEISKAVVLALFVPLIISSGGNTGSQAATLIIRAMAVKELSLSDWWFVMRREIFSGLLLGFILGSIGFVRIALWQKFHWFDYGEHWILIAITIFLSLIGIVMWGALSGSMVPMILKKIGLDPAASSAPFVATLVDVTGLIIYFTIAAVILKGTLL